MSLPVTLAEHRCDASIRARQPQPCSKQSCSPYFCAPLCSRAPRQLLAFLPALIRGTARNTQQAPGAAMCPYHIRAPCSLLCRAAIFPPPWISAMAPLWVRCPHGLLMLRFPVLLLSHGHAPSRLAREWEYFMGIILLKCLQQCRY